ncbi:cold-shock protein [Bradyrhizobium zhanjiangense]|nr:cold-shock protein [Bradyrhizobium zhanjiangense]
MSQRPRISICEAHSCGCIGHEIGGEADVFVQFRTVEKAGYTALAEGARVSFERKTGS